MSDANNQQELQALAEQLRQLNIAPDTPVRQLPAHVQQLLADYLNQGTLSYGPDAYGDADLQGVLSKVAPIMDAANTQSVVDRASKTGVITPDEKKKLDSAGKDTTGLAVSALPDTPRWILQTVQQNGGVGDPSDPEKHRITDEWNSIFGTKFSWEQLVQQPSFNDPTDTAQKIVQGALLDVEPIVSYKVTLPGMRSVDITSDQQKTQFQAFGYDNKQIARIVRWADAYNLTDSTGHTAWQPLAALLKAKGLDAGMGYQDQSGFDPETGKKLPKTPQQQHRHGGSGLPAPPPPNDVRGAANQLSVAFVTQSYKQNLNRYGDPTIAYLATMDQGLADRLLMSGGDSTKVTDKDAILAEQYMLNGQWSPDIQRGLGYASGSGLDAFMQSLNQRNHPSGSVRMRPDPASVKQTVKDFWRQMFRQDPSEGLIDKMSGELMAAVASAPEDQQVDIEARLRQMAEASPQYQQLYGKKQPGQTEADYQAQFLAAAQDIQGNQAPDQGSIIAGMETGQYQTTVGATAASALAQQNSKFLGRLATAAQIVNERT